MKRATRAAALLVLVLALAACGPARGADEAGESNDRIHEFTERLADGRQVTCLVYESGYAGVLSCDWAGTR